MPPTLNAMRSDTVHKSKPLLIAVAICTVANAARATMSALHKEYAWSYVFDPEDHEDCVLSKDKKSKEWDALNGEYIMITKHHKGDKALEAKGKCGDTLIVGLAQTRGSTTVHGTGAQQEKLLADIKAGKGRKYIFEEYASYCERYHAWVDKAFTLHAPLRRWMPAVYWIHGASGLDKSRMAKAVCARDSYCKLPDTKWFDGYDGQGVLILNDLRKSTFTYSYMLELLDRYEFRVEVKGAVVPLLAKVIIITCSKSHEDLWAELGGTENERIDQLTRRIKEEFHITNETQVYECQRLVHRMRVDYRDLKKPENWDVEEKYDDWDGEAELEEPHSKKLKVRDDTMSTSSSSS